MSTIDLIEWLLKMLTDPSWSTQSLLIQRRTRKEIREFRVGGGNWRPSLHDAILAGKSSTMIPLSMESGRHERHAAAQKKL